MIDEAAHVVSMEESGYYYSRLLSTFFEVSTSPASLCYAADLSYLLSLASRLLSFCFERCDSISNYTKMRLDQG